MIHIIFWSLIAWNVAIVTIGIVKKQAHRIYIHSGLLLFFAAVGFMPYWEAPSVVWKTGLVISATASIPFIPAVILQPGRGKLITKGIYGYIRHPMHLAMFILCFGLMLWSPSIDSITSFIFLCICSRIAQGKEERELLAKFDSEYEEYKQRVPGLNIVSGYSKLKRSMT